MTIHPKQPLSPPRKSEKRFSGGRLTTRFPHSEAVPPIETKTYAPTLGRHQRRKKQKSVFLILRATMLARWRGLAKAAPPAARACPNGQVPRLQGGERRRRPHGLDGDGMSAAHGRPLRWRNHRRNLPVADRRKADGGGGRAGRLGSRGAHRPQSGTEGRNPLTRSPTRSASNAPPQLRGAKRGGNAATRFGAFPGAAFGSFLSPPCYGAAP